MTSNEEMLSNFEKAIGPTKESIDALIKSLQPFVEQTSKIQELIQPIVAYQSPINEAIQPAIKQLLEMKSLINTDSFKAINDLLPEINSVFLKKYQTSNIENLDFNSTYKDLLNQIEYFECSPLNSKQRDELIQNIEFVSNELTDSSEIPLGELNNIEDGIEKTHDESIDQQHDWKEHQRYSNGEAENSNFQIFLQGISSRLRDPDWQSEQAAANIMSSFYTFILTLGASVVSGKLDPIIFLIILRLLLSLFPKH